MIKQVRSKERVPDVGWAMLVGYLHHEPERTKDIKGLRKVKSRSMATAMREGVYEKGNHRITYIDGEFGFYYRDTLIYVWYMPSDMDWEIDAGDFEGTVSTRNQRREIVKSIEQFREGIRGMNSDDIKQAEETTYTERYKKAGTN